VLAQTCEPCEVMCAQSVAWRERSVGTSSDRRFPGTRSSRIPGQVGPWPPPFFLASALSITFSDMLRAAQAAFPRSCNLPVYTSTTHDAGVRLGLGLVSIAMNRRPWPAPVLGLHAVGRQRGALCACIAV
jgi:hypothetical protein